MTDALPPEPPTSPGRFPVVALLVGPCLAIAAGTVAAGLGMPADPAWCAATVVLCAVWWLLEPLPVGATSLAPLVLLPLGGVLTASDAAGAYGSPFVLLLLGGFWLGAALEKSGAHRRLALVLVAAVGGRGGRRIVLGFMLAAGLLSMWISNAATTLILLPVALAVLERAPDRARLAPPLLLGLAYAASIGGLGTPVGTPPNVAFMAVYREATGLSLSFSDWLRFGLPTVGLMLPLTWLWLTRSLGRSLEMTVPDPGSWRRPEVLALGVAGLNALLWITRTEPAGGWAGLLGLTNIDDATVVIASCVLLFLLPNGEGGRLLDWPTARAIPWELLLLVGGGVALARGVETSGLAEITSRPLATLGDWPPVLVMLLIATVTTFLTEFTSNTATANLLLPLLAGAAKAAELDPLLLMVPAVLSVSCAFMLPVATLPNAIVMASGDVPPGRMAREGLMVNWLGVAVIVGVCWLVL